VNDLDDVFIGNNWIVSAVAAIAETPGRVEKLFLNNENKMSPAGIYAVQLYALGLPMTVMIDDYFPAIQQDEDNVTTLFSLLDHDTPLWGMLIEKAFAKRYGNYEHITYG